MKPITIHITPSGPNPWKVVWIAEELAIPYEINSFSYTVVKQKPFTDINPNGRVPAIHDPNTNLTLWESGAIIHYLITQYDTTHKLSYPTLTEQHLCNQWLFFQTSGQGPYFGQAGWFYVLHPERLPSATARYHEEIKRVLGVLEVSLQGKQWLVGDKCTYADMVFVPYNNIVELLMPVSAEHKFDEFPNVKAWHQRLVTRESWGRIMEVRLGKLDEQGLRPDGRPKGMQTDEEYAKYVEEGGKKSGQ